MYTEKDTHVERLMTQEHRDELLANRGIQAPEGTDYLYVNGTKVSVGQRYRVNSDGTVVLLSEQ